MRLVQELERRQAESLEGVGRGARLEGAAAQDAGTLALDPSGRLHQLLARLDRARPGHDDELLAEPELHPVDTHPRAFDLVLGAGQLVGRADPDHLLDAVEGAEVGDALEVAADDADHGALLAHADERLEAVLLDGPSDPVDLVLRRRRTHHHDHRSCLSLTAPIRIGETKNAGAFASCVCGHECLRRRDLLACLVPASRKTTSVTLDGGAYPPHGPMSTVATSAYVAAPIRRAEASLSGPRADGNPPSIVLEAKGSGDTEGPDPSLPSSVAVNARSRRCIQARAVAKASPAQARTRHRHSEMPPVQSFGNLGSASCERVEWITRTTSSRCENIWMTGRGSP